MPALPKTKTSQTVWLAKWDHKHGEDISIHTTEEGARKQLAIWARGALEDDVYHSIYPNASLVPLLDHPFATNAPGANLSDEALVKAWPEITGETEFLFVEDHTLYGPEVWDEVSEKSIKEIDVFDVPK